MSSRRLIIGAHDLVMTAVALLVSFLLRWGQVEFWHRIEPISLACLVTLPFAIGAYWFFRLPQTPWKYVADRRSEPDRPCGDGPGRLPRGRRLPDPRRLRRAAHRAGHLLARAGVSARRSARSLPRLPQPAARPAGVQGRLPRSGPHRRHGRRGRPAHPPPQARLPSVRSTPWRCSPPRRAMSANASRGCRSSGELTQLEEVLGKLEIRHVRPRRLIVTRATLETAPGIDDLLGTARRLGLATVQPVPGADRHRCARRSRGAGAGLH